MLKIPHCLDNGITDGGKVVRPTHPLHSTSQKHYCLYVSGTHFCYRLSKPQGLVRPEELSKFKKSLRRVYSDYRSPQCYSFRHSGISDLVHYSTIQGHKRKRKSLRQSRNFLMELHKLKSRHSAWSQLFRELKYISVLNVTKPHLIALWN
jgi:hypothetical protein